MNGISTTSVMAFVLGATSDVSVTVAMILAATAGLMMSLFLLWLGLGYLYNFDRPRGNEKWGVRGDGEGFKNIRDL